MKQLLIIILLAFGTVAFSQSREHIIVDTLDYVQFDIVNWELHFGPTTDSTFSICEIDTNSVWGIAGRFTTYLVSSNIILIDGEFRLSDSVKFWDCIDSSYRLSDNRFPIPMPVGIWKFYSSNGSIKSTGGFSDRIHQYRDLSYPIWHDTINGMHPPVPVSISDQFLKNGTWEYYNEKGENHMSEEYFHGVLVERIKRY